MCTLEARRSPIADPDKKNTGVGASRFAPAPHKPGDDGDITIVRLDHAPGKTHPVDKNDKGAPVHEVALFMPKGFDPSKPAIMVPYFHGHDGSINDALTRQKLTELAAKSGKNICFVIPQLGKKSDIADDFKLDPKHPEKSAKAGARFLDEAADALAKFYVSKHPEADAAKTAKAFHDMPVVTMTYSGGYEAAWSTLTLPKVKGAIVLDSMYSSARPFVDFARRDDKPFVAVTYGESTQKHVGEFVAGAPSGSYSVIPNPKDHGILVQNTLEKVFQSLNTDGRKVTYDGLSDQTPLVAAATKPKPAPMAKR